MWMETSMEIGECLLKETEKYKYLWVVAVARITDGFKICGECTNDARGVMRMLKMCSEKSIK